MKEETKLRILEIESWLEHHIQRISELEQRVAELEKARVDQADRARKYLEATVASAEGGVA